MAAHSSQVVFDSSAVLTGTVAPYQGRPALHINGQPVAPVLYALTDIPASRSYEAQPQRNLRNFAAQGFRMFQVDVALLHCWRAPEAFDIDLARRQVRGVLDACPEAAVFLRVHLNAPRWWMLAHPEEEVGYANGPAEDDGEDERFITKDLARPRRVSLASERWRQEMGERLAEFCRQLAESPEGDRVVSIQVACGVYGEWHYWGFTENDPDTGPAMTRYFRRWLREKYATDAALRAAWADPAASLDTATVPDTAARQSLAGVFRDPGRERRVIDYYQCQHTAVVDDILHFCRVAKQHWPRPLITGTFYGYFFGMFGRVAQGGHLEMEKILASPDVDFLSQPQSYVGLCRDMGGTGQSRGLLEAARLRGKLTLVEMDEPPVGGLEQVGGDPAEIPESIAIMRRQVLEPFLRGAGLWYYDFGPGKPVVGMDRKSGWWDRPELLAEVKRLKTLMDARFARPYRPVADVAFVYDTRVYYYLASQQRANAVVCETVDSLSAAAYHAGVALETLLLSDLRRVDWSRYRAVVFANTLLLSPEERRFIREEVARDGRHLLWNYAPGYTDGTRLDTRFISEVTGMQVDHADTGVGEVHLEGEGLPTTRYAATTTPEPLFTVVDADAAPLGRLAGTATVAAARKRLADSTAWFFSLPPCNSNLLRAIFSQAGAHLYHDSNDVLHAGAGLLLLHTLPGGKRQIRLRSGETVTVELPPCSTTVLDAESGEVVLR